MTRHVSRTVAVPAALLLLGIWLSGCGQQSAPAKPSAPASSDSSAKPVLESQSWLGASRMPAPAGTHQRAFGSVQMGPTTSADILVIGAGTGIVGDLAEMSGDCGSASHWSMSADAQTLIRQIINCNGVNQYAILHRASSISYVGYWTNIDGAGNVGFGPFRMTRAEGYQNYTGALGAWKAEFAGVPLTQGGGETVISPDGKADCGGTTLTFSFVDAESQLERLGQCMGGANISSLGRVGSSSTYTGFFSDFSTSDVPNTLGGYAMKRPEGKGLAGTWQGNWGSAAVESPTKDQMNLNAQGEDGLCTRYLLSRDGSTMLRDYTGCSTLEGGAELHRVPGTNTFAGYYTHYFPSSKTFAMGPIQVKLSSVPTPTPTAGAVVRITLEGKSLLTSSTDSGNLKAIGLDAQGNRVTLSSSDVEWNLSDDSGVTLSPNSDGSAGLTPKGFAPNVINVVARLKSNATLSAQGSVVLATLQPGVKTVSDADIVWPPVRSIPVDQALGEYALPNISNQGGELNIGGFSANEVSDAYDYNDASQTLFTALVTRMPLNVGDKVLGSGQGTVAGTVVNVTSRNGYQLAQLEQGGLGDYVDEFKLDTSTLNKSSASLQGRSRLSTQSINPDDSLVEVFKNEDFSCKFEGSPEIVKLDLVKNLKLPSFIPVFNIDTANKSASLGLGIGEKSTSLHLEPTLDLKAAGKVSYTCTYTRDFPIPLDGWLAIVALPVVKTTVKLEGTLSAESTDLLGSLSTGYVVDVPGISGRYVANFSVSNGVELDSQNRDLQFGGPQLYSPFWIPKFPKSEMDPGFRAKLGSTATMSVEAVAGVSFLSGEYIEQLKKLSDRAARSKKAAEILKKLKDALWFDLITAGIGAKSELNWNNTGYEFDEAQNNRSTSLSVAKGSLPVNFLLKDAKLEALFKKLKLGGKVVKLGPIQFKTPEKLQWGTPDGSAIELGTAFRALKQNGAIKLNGRIASLENASVLEPGKAYPLELGATHPVNLGFLKSDSAPIFARLYYTADGKVDGAVKTLGGDLSTVTKGANNEAGDPTYTIAGNLTVPSSFCTDFPKGTTVYALGYNKLMAFETPGFLGSFKLECGNSLEDSGFFKVNSLTFARDGNNNDAIVGKACSKPGEENLSNYVDITGNLTPREGWTIQNAQLLLDGDELSRYPDSGSKYAAFGTDGKSLILAEQDPARFSYDPMTGRIIPTGSHTLRYSAILKDASGKTRSSEFSRTLEFRAKSVDANGICNPAPPPNSGGLPKTGDQPFDDAPALCGGIAEVVTGTTPGRVVGNCSPSGLDDGQDGPKVNVGAYVGKYAFLLLSTKTYTWSLRAIWGDPIGYDTGLTVCRFAYPPIAISSSSAQFYLKQHRPAKYTSSTIGQSTSTSNLSASFIATIGESVFPLFLYTPFSLSTLGSRGTISLIENNTQSFKLVIADKEDAFANFDNCVTTRSSTPLP